MKNLVLSAACGLDPEQIKFFLKSLRKYYEDEILFLIRKEDIEVKKLLKRHSCGFIEINVHKFDSIILAYQEALNKSQVDDNILMFGSFFVNSEAFQ